MELKKAYEKAGPDDKLTRVGNKSLIIEAKYTELVSLHDVAQLDWQIIPAKKEMVVFDEFWVNACLEQIIPTRTPYECGENRKEDAEIIWQASEQNRDILYADLMGMVAKILDVQPREEREDLISSINAELAKINAVLNPIMHVQV